MQCEKGATPAVFRTSDKAPDSPADQREMLRDLKLAKKESLIVRSIGLRDSSDCLCSPLLGQSPICLGRRVQVAAAPHGSYTRSDRVDDGAVNTSSIDAVRRSEARGPRMWNASFTRRSAWVTSTHALAAAGDVLKRLRWLRNR